MYKLTALGLATLLALGGTGCSLDGVLDSDQLPPDVSDPAITQTPNGARRAYAGTLAQFRAAFAGENVTDGRLSFVAASGLLTDELQLAGVTSGVSIDRRAMPEGASDASPYAALQKVRNQAGQAIGLLSRYLADESALQAHLYALQGYTEVFLAELFCSGIPLSTLDYDGDYTYHAGSSTEDVFTHATTLFDTALELAGDDPRIRSLARVGKARALLALAQYADAAAAVADVADGDRYEVSYSSLLDEAGTLRPYSNFGLSRGSWAYTIPDAEGTNGLNWRTSEDPRTPLAPRTLPDGAAYSYPSQFDTLGGNPIVLASGVEARLIEAEAALQAGGDWLGKLNALRTTGSEERPTEDPNDGAATYTYWRAGAGGVDSLPLLADPGTDEGRVDLLFRERGFWLFLTGHRQGDLRRLIRQYDRRQDETYPVGSYRDSGTPYGSDVTVPIPPAESANPLFTGCFSRSA